MEVYVDTRIINAVKKAHAITWDECHKIYISADDEATANFQHWGYSTTSIDDISELGAATVLQQ